MALTKAPASMISGGVTVPTGTIAAFSDSVLPDGYIKCNGSITLSTTTYADLFAVIGYTYGGSGSEFGVPDFRGEFIRGLDDGRGVDSGRVLGDGSQADAYGSHNHHQGISTNKAGLYSYTTLSGTDAANGTESYTRYNYTSTEGETETRPRNVTMLYCIKY